MTDQGAMPAYPCVLEEWKTVPGYEGEMTQNHKAEYSGLTKREVFAMAAMQGMAVTHDHRGQWSPEADLVAKRSVEYADALLAALSDQPTRQEG